MKKLMNKTKKDEGDLKIDEVIFIYTGHEQNNKLTILHMMPVIIP